MHSIVQTPSSQLSQSLSSALHGASAGGAAAQAIALPVVPGEPVSEELDASPLPELDPSSVTFEVAPGPEEVCAALPGVTSALVPSVDAPADAGPS